MINGFTLEQAEEIREDFEDLEGTEYRRGDTKCEIDAVVIAPAHDADRMQFLAAYYASHDAASALAQYAGNEFSVIIIAYDLHDKNTPLAMDITDYVAANGVGYNFPNAGA